MYLIKGGLVRQYDGEKVKYEILDILTDGNMIRKISEKIEQPDAEVIDADGMLIIPGLINSHIHSHDNFNKAWLENMPLEIWMPVVRPFFSGVRHTPEMVYYRTLLGASEMIRTGTTAVMDDVLLNSITDEECLDAIVRAYRDIGMRAVVCPHTKNISMEKTIPYADGYFTDEMREAVHTRIPCERTILGFMENMLDKYNLPDATVTVGLSTSAPQRCTKKLLKGMKDLSKRYDVPVSCHMLETYVQKCTGPRFYKKSLVRYMHDLGILDKNAVLVHCNWITEDDLELMADSGCSAVHNPCCNLRMGSGIAPVHDIIGSVPMGLGTDNISASDCANMFEAMKTGCLISKVRTAEYRNWLTASDVVKMATSYGSKCLNMEGRVGNIKEGMKADLTMINMRNEHYAMAYDMDMALVYSENGSGVDTVISDGRIILQGGKLTNIDEDAMFETLKEIRKDIIEEHELAIKESKGVVDVFDKCYRKCNAPRFMEDMKCRTLL